MKKRTIILPMFAAFLLTGCNLLNLTMDPKPEQPNTESGGDNTGGNETGGQETTHTEEETTPDLEIKKSASKRGYQLIQDSSDAYAPFLTFLNEYFSGYCYSIYIDTRTGQSLLEYCNSLYNNLNSLKLLFDEEIETIEGCKELCIQGINYFKPIADIVLGSDGAQNTNYNSTIESINALNTLDFSEYLTVMQNYYGSFSEAFHTVINTALSNCNVLDQLIEYKNSISSAFEGTCLESSIQETLTSLENSLLTYPFYYVLNASESLQSLKSCIDAVVIDGKTGLLDEINSKISNLAQVLNTFDILQDEIGELSTRISGDLESANTADEILNVYKSATEEIDGFLDLHFDEIKEASILKVSALFDQFFTSDMLPEGAELSEEIKEIINAGKELFIQPFEDAETFDEIVEAVEGSTIDKLRPISMELTSYLESKMEGPIEELTPLLENAENELVIKLDYSVSENLHEYANEIQNQLQIIVLTQSGDDLTNALNELVEEAKLQIANFVENELDIYKENIIEEINSIKEQFSSEISGQDLVDFNNFVNGVIESINAIDDIARAQDILDLLNDVLDYVYGLGKY